MDTIDVYLLNAICHIPIDCSVLIRYNMLALILFYFSPKGEMVITSFLQKSANQPMGSLGAAAHAVLGGGATPSEKNAIHPFILHELTNTHHRMSVPSLRQTAQPVLLS